MSRLLQYAERYAEDAFRAEVREQQKQKDLLSKQALSDAAGIPRQTLCKRIQNPGSMSVEELRKLVIAIKPDPTVILTLLGYSKRDINRIPESKKTAMPASTAANPL